MNLTRPENFRPLPISLLVPAPWNYKEQDEALSKKLRENIRRNGQLENIIVRQLPTGYYEVVNGNHRLDVMVDLGYSEVLVYDCGPIGLTEAQRLAIETNETRFASDQFVLAERIGELRRTFGDVDLVETLPFSLEQVKNFERLLDFDWDTVNTEPPAPADSTPTEGKTLDIRITPSTLDTWKAWCQRCREKYNLTEAWEFLEYAIIAALDTPAASIR